MGEIEIYFEIGTLPESVTAEAGIANLPVLMKYEYNQSIRNGQIYKELQQRENDYIYFEEAYFAEFVEYPHQIRQSKNNSLLLVRSYAGYYSDGRKHDAESYALRIVKTTDDKNKPCWEAIEFDINYTAKQNDTLLWQTK